jgi:hypothetical protein
LLFNEEIELSNEDMIDLHNYLCECLFTKSEETDTTKTIDYVQDYKYIWDSFKATRNIDLNTDIISWWEFNSVLECILIEGNNSMSKVLEYRLYEKPLKRGGEERRHTFMMKMKHKYELKLSEEETQNIVQKGIRTMMNYFLNKERK